MSRYKDKRPKEAEDGLVDRIKKNQMCREAEKIIKEVEKNKELEDVEASDYMYDKIKNKIEEYEQDKRADEYLRQIMEEDDDAEESEEEKSGYDKTAVYALLSKEDREALKLGKEIQTQKNGYRKSKKGWKVLKKAAAFVIIISGMFGISMISESNRAYVLEKVNHIVGGTLITKVHTKGDNIVDKEDYDELRAFEKVKKELGIIPMRFNYKPPGMEYSKSEISSLGYAYFFYYYDDKVVSIYIDKATSVQSVSEVSSADKVTRVKLNDLKVDVDIYRLEDNDDKVCSYKADIIHLNTYYSIMGKMKLQEFKKMLENVVFY